MLRQLRLHPFMKVFHQGPAVLLMEAQPVFRRQFLFPRLRVVVINAAQRLQHITAFFRKFSTTSTICRLPWARQFASTVSTPSTFGVLPDTASHISTGP